MNSLLVLNAKIVNEGSCSESDLLARNGRIERIGPDLSSLVADEVIDASGLHLIPGLIDDQVHFREPGLTHKATIATDTPTMPMARGTLIRQYQMLVSNSAIVAQFKYAPYGPAIKPASGPCGIDQNSPTVLKKMDGTQIQ